MKQKQLVFSDVDDLAFASIGRRFNGTDLPVKYFSSSLGPLLELIHLSEAGRLPRPGSWLTLGGIGRMIEALRQNAESWIAPEDQHAGFMRALRKGLNGGSRFTAFLMKAKRAGQYVSGLPPAVSGQLVAAMEELENNIHEHANASETGVVAYQAKPGVFEFVVADRGVGILNSLRTCEAYVSLADEGKALQAALTDGVSRHGSDGNRGYGFRPIFVGLVNLRGELRFRSGDHAVTMDGTSPALATSRISQKAPIDGFFASVKCHAGQQ